jgi:hypothetical protein
MIYLSLFKSWFKPYLPRGMPRNVNIPAWYTALPRNGCGKLNPEEKQDNRAVRPPH